jgi:hypothetical protein
MPKNAPRLEALITISGQTIQVNTGAGNVAVSLTDGTYYGTALLAHVQARIIAVIGGVWTVTGNFGFLGDGIVSVTRSGGTFKIQFANDAQAQLFGVALSTSWNGAFQGTWTGTLGMKGVWLPKCPIDGEDLHLGLKGQSRSDESQLIGPQGQLYGDSSNEYFSFQQLMFEMVQDRRAVDSGSSIVNWQSWVRTCLLAGDGTYFPRPGGVAPTVKVYIDADTNTVLGSDAGGDGVYRLVLGEKALGLRRYMKGYAGWWTVDIAELIKV